MQADPDGEGCVGAIAGSCGQTLADLFLKHQDRPLDGFTFFDEQSANRFGDVVREVAGHHPACMIGPPLFPQFCEIDVENVALDQIESISEAILERRDQIAVFFDRDQARNSVENPFRPGTAAGADFKHGLFVCGTERLGQSIQDLLIDEEILSEPFFCAHLRMVYCEHV